MSLRLPLTFALGASLLLASCETGGLPEGWRATPPGDGPMVTWDLDHEPLPDLPLPNDFATYPDPSTATGRRLNVSTVAPTAFEAHTRRGFDTMDGWGTYAPISIPFEEPIDTRGMMDRQGGGSEAFSEDRFQQHAVYLIDLETGEPMPLDVNSGNYPYVVDNPNAYFRNDPRAGESNLFLETVDEDLNDNGEMDPFEDTDFDGVLDEPSTFDGTADEPLDTVDEMTWFYERETNTLVLRPILPLRPQRTYAVVVTDRLTGLDGEPIRSPFPDVHHISQKDALAPLEGHLADHGELYGDLATRGWEGVAFAFTFTTQSIYQEMDAIRDGLHGEGSLEWMADDFPVDYAPVIMRGGTGRCLEGIQNVYIAPKQNFVDALRPVVGMVLGTTDEAKIDRLLASYESLSHVAVIVFDSPFFLGDPRSTGLEDYFDVDAEAGEASVGRETLTMILFIPKETETAQQPFDLAFYVHGYGSASAEPLPFLGYMLQHGVAAATVNAEGHGVPLDSGLLGAVEALFSGECLRPAAQAILSGRAEDLNGDGTPDSGGDFWTSYVFHTRDSVRQSSIDHLRAIQILRSFDGRTAVPTIFDDSPILFSRDGDRTIAYDGEAIGDGADIAGDFDGNGVPDLGGDSDIFFAGGSLGGIVTGIVGGTEPSLRVAAPIVGAGGLTDVAARTDLGAVLRAMHLRAMGPMIITEPADARGDRTQCSAGQTSVYIMATDVTSRAEVEIACADEGLLDADDVLYIYNANAEEARCGGAVGGVDGRFRVPFPADAGHRLFVEIYEDAADIVDYGDCSFEGSPTPATIIDTFEVEGATFQTIEWEVGAPLVSPTMGLGHDRQTPELRRTIALAQAGLDAGDPINYARRVFLEPIDQPINLLVANAIGDQWVPLSAGNAYARAAGLLPFLPPDGPESLADWRAPASFAERYPGYASPNDLLIGWHVLEGVERLERHPTDGLPPHFLVDVDDLAEGGYRFDPSGRRQSNEADAVGYPRLDDPLRWVRRSRAMAEGGDDSVWSPIPGEDISGLVNHYVIPNGTHGFDEVVYDEDLPWDPVQYLINLVARYGVTRGQDLYYHSHPEDHTCLEDSSCSFFEQQTLE